MYKLTKSNSIHRLSDGAFIPTEAGNRDYQEYLEWLAVKGNVPEPAQTLDEIKAEQWVGIKALRDRRKMGGVKAQVGTEADGVTPIYKHFHSDDGSRLQQLGLVMMGASIPANLQWKTMDGSFVTMTQAIANAVFNAVAAHDSGTFKKAEEHKAAMEAATDPAAYDYSGGWPLVYGEVEPAPATTTA